MTQTLIEEIRAAAEAIEHALHIGLLRDLGLTPDSVVLRAMAIVTAEAATLPGGLPALVADDYDHNRDAFARRMRTARWRAAQLHGAEDLYPALTGGTTVRPADADFTLNDGGPNHA